MNELIPPQTDARRSARWDTYLHAEVVNSWQEVSAAVVTNISHQGLRLEGTRALVDVIFPNFQNTAAGGNTVELRMVLKEGIQLTDSNAITICCNSVYVLREKQDRFQIGLCYQDIDAAVASQLEVFIVELQGFNKDG